MRRRRPATSSLELLLDTICNTFGGILFVAMLLAVLVQSARKTDGEGESESPSEVDLLNQQAQVSRTLAELESLQAAVDLQKRLARQMARPEMVEVLARLDDLDRQRNEVLNRHLQEAANVVQLQAESRGLGEQQQAKEEQSKVDEAKRHKRHGQIEGLEQELAETREKLDAETRARTQVARLPMLHDTIKQEVSLVFRCGRLYVWHKYSPAGQKLGLNTDDFVVIEENAQGLLTLPKPYAGVPISDEDASRLAVRELLAPFRAARQYLTIVVWPDSFDQFQNLKRVLVSLGFEYRLIPMPPGETIYDRGGSDGRVQ